MNADSLISTYGVTFYNSAAKKGALNASLNPALNGVQPYRASNGYIYRLPRYDLDPSFAWVKEIKEYAIFSAFKVLSHKNFRTAGTFIHLEEGNYNNYRPKLDEKHDTVRNEKGEIEMTGIKGDIYNNSYVRFEIDNERSESELHWRLPQVFSTKYEVEMVMLPSKVDLDFPNANAESVDFTDSVQDDEGYRISFMQ